MTGQSWNWSLGEALYVIGKTYRDDWGRDQRQRTAFVQSHEYIQEIDVNGITALKAGNGKQDVLFIHGSPGNAMRWDIYLKKVPDDYTFYSIDRMGFGGRKDQQPDLEKDYELILDFAKLLKNPIIVGHSLGGAIVARLAADLDQVKSLIFVAASLDPSLEKIIPFQRIGRSSFISWVLTSSIRHSNEEMFQLVDFLNRMKESVSNIECPVHVFHAKDDGLVPIETIEFIQREFSNVNSLQIISPEVGGHAIPWTQPEVIFNLLEESKAA